MGEMVAIAGVQVSTDFIWAIMVSGLTAILLALEMRIFRKEIYDQTGWMDWCGYFALAGIPIILVGGILDLRILMAAGVLLLFPLYPIAILGLIGKLDDIRISLVRGWRER
jgi:hypothetical protein